MLGKNLSEILEENVGLFQNMLGGYADLVAIDQRKEKAKKVLHDVYGYKDIYRVVPKTLDQESLDRTLKTVFGYYEQKEIRQEEGILKN